ncbi:MAG: hypothetical protein UX07_C0003G0001, partial [Parcubacteria group bacterium GW2011_GWA2_45_30]
MQNQTQKSKFEYRNSKQIRSSNIQKQNRLRFGILDLGIVSDFGFRISDFKTFILRFLCFVFLLSAAFTVHASIFSDPLSREEVVQREEVSVSDRSFLAAIMEESVSFFRRVFGRKNAEEQAAVLDGQAIRAKNRSVQSSSPSAVAPGVTIMTPSFFRQEAEFSNEVTIRGLLRGTDVDLGQGIITASNIIYNIEAGDGILVTGDSQRPVISQEFWARSGDRIVTRDPGISLEIGGGIFLGTPARSSLTFNGPATLDFASTSSFLLPPDLANAWTISSSATGSPVVTISTRGGGAVGIGTTSISARFTVAAFPDAAQNIFEAQNASGSAEFVITGGGNVGIGTSAPSASFSVVGSSSLAGRVDVDGVLDVSGDTFISGNTLISGKMDVFGTSTFDGTVTASTSVYLAAKSGRVGIGTTNPSELLSVNGAFGVTGDAKFAAAALLQTIIDCSGSGVLETDPSGRIVCGQDAVGQSGGSGVVMPGGGGQLAYYTSGADIVDNAYNLFFIGGNLGVGTSSPATTTSVAGDIYLTGGLGVGKATSVPGVIETTGVISVQGSGTSTFANGIQIANGCFRLPQGSCAGAIGSGGGVNLGTANRLAYYSDVAVIDSANYLATDAANLRLGIGTTSPLAKLSIHANNQDPVQNYLFAIASSTASATTTHFVVTNTGNVGIGTAGPIFKLNVLGDDKINSSIGVQRISENVYGPYQYFVKSRGSATGTPLVGDYMGGLIWSAYNDNSERKNLAGIWGQVEATTTGSESGSIVFFTVTDGNIDGPDERMIIKSTGNVGIGTTTPGSILSIQGVANFQAATSTLYTGLTAPGFLATSSGLTITGGSINLSSGATSTFNNGLALTNGCFLLIDNSCAASAAAGGAISGWIDDGATVRLLSAGDQVSIGQATPFSPAGLSVLATSTSATAAIFRSGGGTTANIFDVQRADGNSFLSVSATGSAILSQGLLHVGTTTGTSTIASNLQVAGMIQAGRMLSTGTTTSDLGFRLQESAASPSFYASLVSADLDADKNYILPNFTGSNATLCLTTGNCAGAGSGITGSGVAGQVSFFDGTQSITGENDLFWITASKRLGVGTSSPGAKLTVGGETFLGGNLTATGTLIRWDGAQEFRIANQSTSTILNNASTS